jgi:phosphatidylserine decarboxylase
LGDIPIRIAKEGYRFVFTALGLAAAALAVGWFVVGVVLVAVAVAVAGFFRDPERVSPDGEGIVVSPADGKVVSVDDVSDADGRRVSIFLSPLDVHINRAPMNGRVADVRYQTGHFLAAYKGKASDENERNAIELVDDAGTTLRIVQIAGFLARRIVCDVGRGDSLKRGERFGMIMFGSRVDLFLPRVATVEVHPGQRVRGGETIVARLQC